MSHSQHSQHLQRFHGSYRPQDVEFLLKPLALAQAQTENVADKERLIQSGARHYSEMLTPESLPSPAYRALFARAHALNRERMARDCLVLASLVARHHGPAPVLVSLARAGTPVGAIVAHLLRACLGAAAAPVAHYSVSIVRDRGIDTNALDHILAQRHAPESLAFVDGWTGKGVISRELERFVQAYNHSRQVQIESGLYVLSDLAGSARCAASGDDYLIPSSILNATISGLVSRSILNSAIGPQDFHGCVWFGEFAEADLSCWFVDDIVSAALAIFEVEGMPAPAAANRAALAAQSQDFMASELARQGIQDANLIKPGIGEATRVLLRRLPRQLLVRDPEAENVQHLLVLAHEKSVPVQVRPDLPYHAVSIIRSVQDA